jgi:hypothetical protein
MIVNAGSRVESGSGCGVAMEDRSTRLGIHVALGPDADAEDIATATSQLRRELLDLDLEAVDMPRERASPPGTRAADVAALGTLAVSIGQSQLLAAVVAAVRSWLARSQGRSIKLELGGDALELTGVSSHEQRRLTDEWLRRHEIR